MEWKKRKITSNTIEIVRVDKEGKESSWHADMGDSLHPIKSREIEITTQDRLITITPHAIEHYHFELYLECIPGTLGSCSDILGIGVTDDTEIRYISRYIGNTADSPDHPPSTKDIFYFQKNELTEYQGRPKIEIDFEGENIKETPFPGFTNGILDDRATVLNEKLKPHYETFKQLRPDIAKSLDACLARLQKQ